MKNLLKSCCFAILLPLVLACFAGSSRADEDVDGVCGIYPAVEGGYMAVVVPMEPGVVLSNIRWFNNDGQQAFSRLMVLEAAEGCEPDLEAPGFARENVWGLSSGWSELAFNEKPGTTTGFIAIVFEIPAGASRIADGAFGGAGIGYVEGGNGYPAYIGVDGEDWSHLHSDFSLALEVTTVPGLPSAMMVTGMQGETDGQDADEQAVTKEGRMEAAQTALLGPQPNPFNPRTEIRYSLAREGNVRIEVFDVRGRRVRALRNEVQPAGLNSVLWHGNDANGQSVASGTYLVRMEFDGQSLVKRLTLIR